MASFGRDAGRVFGFDVKATDRQGAESGRSSIANVFVSTPCLARVFALPAPRTVYLNYSPLEITARANFPAGKWNVPKYGSSLPLFLSFPSSTLLLLPPPFCASLGNNLDSLFCSIQFISHPRTLVGVCVRRSEASSHGHGTEAYRDRAGAREHHHVSSASQTVISRICLMPIFCIVYTYCFLARCKTSPAWTCE